MQRPFGGAGIPSGWAGPTLRRFAGVTFIELVIVVAVFSAIGLFASTWLAQSVGRRGLDMAAAQAVDALREAQSSVMSGKNAARFGVHFEAGEFVFFQGAVYNPADAGNVVHPLTGDVAIASINLSGGGPDVHFADHRGVPSENGTVVFSSSYGASRTVTIGAAGMIASD